MSRYYERHSSIDDVPELRLVVLARANAYITTCMHYPRE